jgi:hypothetical protein
VAGQRAGGLAADAAGGAEHQGEGGLGHGRSPLFADEDAGAMDRKELSKNGDQLV